MFQLRKKRNQVGFATRRLRLQACKSSMVTGIRPIAPDWVA